MTVVPCIVPSASAGSTTSGILHEREDGAAGRHRAAAPLREERVVEHRAADAGARAGHEQRVEQRFAARCRERCRQQRQREQDDAARCRARDGAAHRGSR